MEAHPQLDWGANLAHMMGEWAKGAGGVHGCLPGGVPWPGAWLALLAAWLQLAHHTAPPLQATRTRAAWR